MATYIPYVYGNTNIRTIEKDNKTWFVGKDVASVLGYERPTKAIADHVDCDDKDVIPIRDSIGRPQNTPIVTESGLYALIFGSKLPTAKDFKRWVTSEVLPIIRTTGTYGNANTTEVITPERAAEMLSKNKSNRKINQANVRRIADDMLTGNYKLNGETIKFYADGTLADGQHRLTA